MRFMVIRKADKDTEAGKMPSEELLAAMISYNEELVKAGIMKDGIGLQPSSKGARVRITGGNATVIDGPFAEAKELIAGFSLIEVGSKEEAIEIVKRWPREDGDVEIEIRQIFEPQDFGDSPAVERMEALRKGSA